MTRRFLLLAVVCGAIYGSAASVYAAEPTIEIIKDSSGQPAVLEVSGIPPSRLTSLAAIPAGDQRWEQSFALYVADEDSQSPPAMLGTYAVEGERLRFTPRYGVRPGMKYQAVLRLPASDAASGPTIVRREIAIPESKPSEPTKLIAIYPSAEVLPENQLRFYLHFSAPMGRGEAYQYLRMLNEKDQPIDIPFLEIGEELWDPSGTRLTLLIDPGRIKQGVKPREDLGPVLTDGGKYQLVVAPGWRDEAGHPLAVGASKRFRAGPPRNAALDQHDWKILTPAAGSREPLVIKFPQPLDHALLQRTIVVARTSSESCRHRGTSRPDHNRRRRAKVGVPPRRHVAGRSARACRRHHARRSRRQSNRSAVRGRPHRQYRPPH